MNRALFLGVALALLAGCAHLPPPTSQAQPPAATPAPTVHTAPAAHPTGVPGSQVGTTASGGTIRINDAASDTLAAAAAADTMPSHDAATVLETIPEPLGRASDRVTSRPPPSESPVHAAPVLPEGSSGTSSGATGSAPGGGTADSTRATADSSAVPVPEPTQPLGDRPGSRLTMPDSLTARPSSPPASESTSPAPPPSAPTPSAPAPTSPDSCWRVQVAAKPERPRSERLMAAAQSQLQIPWVIEREQGLYKVRTRDCMSSAAADNLKRRAIAAGFDGAFKVRKKP